MLHKVELHSLKRTKQEKKKHDPPKMASREESETYPWETRMDLGEEIVEKVPGLEKVAVGDEIMIEALAKVIRKSTQQHQHSGEAEPKKTTTIEIQITEMGMAPKGTYEDAFKERAKQKKS